MAYKKGKGTKKSSSKSKYTELERQAYNMGKIKRGLSNPNSRVYESYNNGLKGTTSKTKKPLI